MSWKILVSAPYMQPVFNEYRSMLEELDGQVETILPPVNERLSEGELLQLIGDIDGVICGDDAFSDRVLSEAHRLKVISKWGTGIDSIDQESARRRGITVCNTEDAFTHPVADSVLGYMLSFARGIPWMDQAIKNNRWEKTQGFSLREATLGIIGLGNVGRAVAQRAAAFGMHILGHDTAEIPSTLLEANGVQLVSKQEVLASSDFVTLHCDLNPSSHHIISGSELQQMKSTAYLINTARGPLIDEPALIRALEERYIAGAAMDVFEIEPLPRGSGLRRLNNCLMAPHNANSSPEAYQKVHENTIRNLVLNLKSCSPQVK